MAKPPVSKKSTKKVATKSAAKKKAVSKKAAPAKKKAAPAKKKAAPAKKKAVPAKKKAAPAKKKAVPAKKKAAPAKKKAVPAKKKAAPAKKKAAPAKKKAVPVKKKAAPAKKKAAPAKKKVAKAASNGTVPAKRKLPTPAKPPKKVKATGFVKKQQQRLLELRDTLMDQMAGVTRDTLRNHAEGSDASAFGMHQADAGSDAYDRDFALNLLSKEHDALYEIEEALKRVDLGRYGVCEVSGKPIGQPRLEAIPFARLTVECQAQLEREQMIGGYRRPIRSLFGLEEGGDNSGFSGSDSVANGKN